ncbi:MAG: hypothetical protein ABJB74_02050 [Gemmatimonas sp.]
MDWFVRAFIKASLAWLSLGVTLGVAMAAYPAWTMYRTAHLHMLVLGFVAMMIYGVAYHVVPRFAGAPLYSYVAPGWHCVTSNVGLAVMCVGFVMRTSIPAAGNLVLAFGGALSAAGAYTFAFVLWRTMDMRSVKPSAVVPLQRPVAGRGHFNS